MKQGPVVATPALAPTQPLMGPAWTQQPPSRLYAWHEPQLNVLRRKLHALHRDWTAAWIARADRVAGPDEIDVDSVVAAVQSNGNATGAQWSFAPGDALSAEGPNARAFDRLIEDLDHLARRALARWMFDINGKGTVPEIARTVADAAWTDWLYRLARLLGKPVHSTTDEAVSLGGMAGADDWSGTLRLGWPWSGGRFQLVLPGELVQSLLQSDAAYASQRVPLAARDQVSLYEALRNETVALQVQLDGASLSLGQLQELQLQDIVVLDHPLDAPVRVLSVDGTLVCEGWLGQKDGHIAVEFARSPMPGSNASPVAAPRS